MTQTQAQADDGKQLSLSDLYSQAHMNMRATDEISLKLLAAVPFVSGVGISLLVRKSTEAFPAEARFGVSLFAAVVTFAIYRWECRNISNCTRYREYAAYLARNYSVAGVISAQREELLRLVEKLPEEKVPAALDDVRRHQNDVSDLAAYTGVISAQRKELLRLVEELPEEKVPAALDDVRRHLQRPWSPAWDLSRKWGKTQAERLLYWTVIVGWLTTGAYVIYP